MKAGYTDTPHNMKEILPDVLIEKDVIVSAVLGSSKCYFYDTCSFRRHANLPYELSEYLLKYIKDQNGIIIITRCVLMELASHSGVLNQEYIVYIKHMKQLGLKVLVIYEEDLFYVMEVCFSTNAAINQYLCWAIRLVKRPASTITETLEKNASINNEVIKGKNQDNSSIYRRFFEAIRSNKESGDNLGEELIAVCLYILSHMPGEADGKFCVITDDKGAAGKIDIIFKETPKQHSGKMVGIFSTPKMVQILYREGILRDPMHMKDILATGTDGNIVVLGMLVYDIRAREIAASKEELTDLIMQPNGITIFF